MFAARNQRHCATMSTGKMLGTQYTNRKLPWAHVTISFPQLKSIVKDCLTKNNSGYDSHVIIITTCTQQSNLEKASYEYFGKMLIAHQSNSHFNFEAPLI